MKWHDDMLISWSRIKSARSMVIVGSVVLSLAVSTVLTSERARGEPTNSVSEEEAMVRVAAQETTENQPIGRSKAVPPRMRDSVRVRPVQDPDSLTTSDGSGGKCDPSVFTVRIEMIETPPEVFAVYKDDPVLLRAYVSTCGRPITDAKVLVSFGNGEREMALLDDGAHGDGPAHDGLYANFWTPTVLGPVNMTIITTHPKWETVRLSRKVLVKMSVAYAIEQIPYKWVDAARGKSHRLAINSSITLPIGFDFDFYGIPQRDVTISSNGYLTFGGKGDSSSNGALPDRHQPNSMIAVFWSELDPGTRGKIYTYLEGEAPARRLTIAWLEISPKLAVSTIPGLSDPPATPGSFQATLYEGSNDIVFRYKNVNFNIDRLDYGYHATVGIEDELGLRATLFSSSLPAVKNETALRYYIAEDRYDMSYRVDMDLSAIQSKSGSLNFFLINSDGVINNKAKIMEFSTDSKNVRASRIVPTSGRMLDTQFVDSVIQPMIFGTKASFILRLTARRSVASYPDTFAIYISDFENGKHYATDDPLDNDALLTLVIESKNSTPVVYRSKYASASLKRLDK